MLRRLTLFAALAVSALFGVNAATASAANCSFGTTATVYSGGVWQWQATAQTCSFVNAVEFRSAAGSSNVYMVDVTRGGAVHFSYAGGGVAYAPNYPSPAPGQYFATYYNNIWGSGCGSPPFTIYKVFQARIHNQQTATWGSWVSRQSGNELIC